MAELISNSDDLNRAFNVEDDVKASSEFEGDRLDILQESSLEELDNTTTGFEDFFKGTEFSDTGFILRGRKVNNLTRDVRSRVDSVLQRSANNFQQKAESDNSSVGKIEATLWKYRKDEVRKSIMSGTIGAAQSLLVAEGEMAFLKEAKRKVGDELESKMSDYEELMNKKLHFWNRIQNNRKHRIEKFTPKLKESIQKTFAELEKNAGKMTGANKTSKIESMGKSVERKIKSASPDKKAKMWEQIRHTINYTGSLTSMNLDEFGITNNQEKISFLEAIRTQKWIREKLTDKSTSESKFQLQESVVESAQAQETKINEVIYFQGVDKIKENGYFKNLPEWGKAVELADLVESIWKDLHRNGQQTKIESWFTDLGNHELLGNATKMKIFLDNLAGSTSTPWELAENLREETRQMLVKWVEDQKGDFEYKSYSNKAVVEQLDILQGLDKKGLALPDYEVTGLTLTDPDKSVLGQIGKSLKQVQSLDITVGGSEPRSLETLIKSFITNSSPKAIETDIQEKYRTFQDTKGDPDFPDKDWEQLNKVWGKVMDARSFILTQIDEWRKNKKEYDKHKEERKTSTDSKLKKIQDAIKELKKDATKPGSIAAADKAVISATAGVVPSIPAIPSAPTGSTINVTPILKGEELVKQWREIATQRRSDLIKLEKEESELLSVKEPCFEGISNIQKHLDALNLEVGLDYAKRIDKNSKPGGSFRPLHERVHDNLKIEFEKEMENTFLRQWEQNDQFDILQKQERGGKVKINFQEVGTLSHMSFPKQLSGIKTGDFKIRRKNQHGVELEGKVNGNDKIIRITKSAVDFSGSEAKVMKNASLFETRPGGRGVNKTSETFCLVTNMQIY